VSVYLTNDEHESLRVLPGTEVRKDRYSAAGGSLDIYDFPKQRLVVFEVEFESEEAAIAFSPPPFVGEEITRDADYSGFALARANAPILPGTALPHS
jgi:CYTH domain-containing protein